MDLGDREHRAALLRILGLAFGLAVVIGGAVGQGIMRAPGLVAGGAVEPWLILSVWLAAGLLAMIDAFAVAELAASHPCAGGPYAFARRAFGPLAGTMIGWTDWLQGTIAMGFIAVVFAEFVHELDVATGVPLGLLGVGLLAAVTAVNWTGTRISGASQTALTLIKAVLLIGLIGALFAAPRGTPVEAPALGPAVTLAGLVVALRAAITTYSGWNGSCYFCEEIDQPERNVARSIFGGLAAVTAIYLLINAALLHVLTPAAIAASKLPAADALQSTWGGSSGVWITVLALISVVAITNLYVMLFPRVTFAVARDGALPAFFAQVASGGTPRKAMVVTSLFAMLFAASGSYAALIAIVSVPAAMVMLANNLSALRLRRTEPDLPRPFRMPLFPLPALVGAALNSALIAAMIWEDPGNGLIGVAVLATIAALYAVRQRSVRSAPA